MPARQSGSPRQQCSGAISAFVDSIDSHIILRMIRESKIATLRDVAGSKSSSPGCLKFLLHSWTLFPVCLKSSQNVLIHLG